MLSENVGGIPMVLTKTGSDDNGHQWQGTWIFALVLIFLAVFFLFGRRDHRDGYGVEAMLPYMMQNKHHDGGRDHWDSMRDTLRESGEIKKEIMGTSWEISKEMLMNFNKSEILGMQNTGEVLKSIAGLNQRLDQDIIRRQGDEINYLKTVAALAPRAPVPAYFPHYNAPVQHNLYAPEFCG